MYFTPEPKTEKKDLFDAEYALASLMDYFHDNTTRMVVIKGLRRVGKTSLLNVGLHESGIKFAKIDVRESPYGEREEFFAFVINHMKQNIDTPFLEKVMKKISGVSIGYKDISTTIHFSKEENFMLFFDNFNRYLGKKKKKFILAFDEAQLLKSIKFDYVIAGIFDNYKNIKVVLSGSEIGLLDIFLGKKDYDAPLFGRVYGEIELKRLLQENMMKFLQAGFEQIKRKISFQEMKDITGNLDGIIGWVSAYGWLRSKGETHENALEKTKKAGSETMKNELEKFLTKRKAKSKYLFLLRSIARGENSWSQLKYNFSKKGTHITDSQLQLYVKELSDYGFLEKEENKYFLSDPMIAQAIR